MPFNINHEVMVRLTDVGRQHYVRHCWEECVKTGCNIPYVAPVEDPNGWSTWQLWKLIQVFGSAFENEHASRLPFETEFRLFDINSIEIISP